jgi:P27 family predicted phage terminase small subunit
MSTRGPVPTPTPILEARGSWRGSVRPGEPRPAVEPPTCPTFLKGESRAEWRRLVKVLSSMHVLAKADRTVLALLCLSWGDYCRAAAYVAKVEAELRRSGRSVYEADGRKKTSRGLRQAMRDMRTSADLVKQLADRFGLSPAARPRLHVVTEDPAESPKAKFFRIAP